MKTFLLLLVSFAAFAQNPYEAVIQQQAMDMATSLSKKDYATLARYTHPSVVKAMGGPEKMMIMTKQKMREMGQKGIRFSNIQIGKPSELIAEREELQCVVPQILTMEMAGRKIRQVSSLVAFSMDGGKRWVFVDTQPGVERMRQIIPSISYKLTIPPRQAPQPIN